WRRVSGFPKALRSLHAKADAPAAPEERSVPPIRNGRLAICSPGPANISAYESAGSVFPFDIGRPTRPLDTEPMPQGPRFLLRWEYRRKCGPPLSQNQNEVGYPNKYP